MLFQEDGLREDVFNEVHDDIYVNINIQGVNYF